MLTVFDKALVAILPGIAIFINQKFGWHINADPDAIAGLVAAISAVLVYFTPNKSAASA